MAAHPPR
ncbi:3-dehydroquinate synthase [Caballeronia sordidicola]|nr:3-dehydroquinate synthase [Caballeronia sordidicola]